jgi:hypothetical protein
MRMNSQSTNNPYCSMAETAKSSAVHCRKIYMESHVVDNPVCVLSRAAGHKIVPGQKNQRNANLVKVSHIIPRSTKPVTLKQMRILDVNDIRNLIALADGIERAFDRMMLSFIPGLGVGMKACYKVKIWDEECLEWPIFLADNNPYSPKVKDFINGDVEFGNLVYKRCLAFQALWASIYYNGGEFPIDAPKFLSKASLSLDEWGDVLKITYGIGADALSAIRHELAEDEEQVGSDPVGEVGAHGMRSVRHRNRKTQGGSKPRPATPSHGDRTKAHQCGDCTKYFSSLAGLKDHHRDKHKLL